MDKAETLTRCNRLIALADGVLESAKRSGGGPPNPNLRGQFRAAGLSLIRDLYGEHHSHYTDFQSQTSQVSATAYDFAKGIILVIREEVHSGWLTRTSSLIAASLFDDFLEMAKHLLDEGYKDAAAVIAGSSLEAHLRRLCVVHNPAISVVDQKGGYKKADLLNAELHKTKAYELTEQKQITAWLGLRNDAAHGHYDKVMAGSVQVMIDGIRHFMTVRPA